jgi:signal transduction histidine kinase
VPTSLDTYSDIVARALAAGRATIARDWLVRLHALLDVEPNEVFPTSDLLDHIPSLIDAIAGYLRAPEQEEIAANTVVIDKARQLGVLRHSQRASVHQLLREYEILGEILETFVATLTEQQQLQPSTSECFDVLGRLTRAVRALMRTTVDTFVAEYTATIAERNERLEQFNRMASHEMRTPLGTLVVAATLLANPEITSDSQKLPQLVGIVKNNVDRLSWLVQHLQRLAKLDAADELNQQRVDVSALANEVAAQLEEMAQARQVTVVVDNSLPTVVIDPARLELILLNLVSNGIKYRSPTTANAFVAMENVHTPQRAGDPWVFRVRDNGIGIPEEAQDAVFKRFFRAHEHLDVALGTTGSGLGLSIVVECVKALDGTVTCESEPGRGTTFIVTLPTGAATTADAAVSERTD